MEQVAMEVLPVEASWAILLRSGIRRVSQLTGDYGATESVRSLASHMATSKKQKEVLSLALSHALTPNHLATSSFVLELLLRGGHTESSTGDRGPQFLVNSFADIFSSRSSPAVRRQQMALCLVLCCWLRDWDDLLLRGDDANFPMLEPMATKEHKEKERTTIEELIKLITVLVLRDSRSQLISLATGDEECGVKKQHASGTLSCTRLQLVALNASFQFLSSFASLVVRDASRLPTAAKPVAISDETLHTLLWESIPDLVSLLSLYHRWCGTASMGGDVAKFVTLSINRTTDAIGGWRNKVFGATAAAAQGSAPASDAAKEGTIELAHFLSQLCEGCTISVDGEELQLRVARHSTSLSAQLKGSPSPLVLGALYSVSFTLAQLLTLVKSPSEVPTETAAVLAQLCLSVLDATLLRARKAELSIGWELVSAALINPETQRSLGSMLAPRHVEDLCIVSGEFSWSEQNLNIIVTTASYAVRSQPHRLVPTLIDLLRGPVQSRALQGTAIKVLRLCCGEDSAVIRLTTDVVQLMLEGREVVTQLILESGTETGPSLASLLHPGTAIPMLVRAIKLGVAVAANSTGKQHDSEQRRIDLLLAVVKTLLSNPAVLFDGASVGTFLGEATSPSDRRLAPPPVTPAGLLERYKNVESSAEEQTLEHFVAVRLAMESTLRKVASGEVSTSSSIPQLFSAFSEFVLTKPCQPDVLQWWKSLTHVLFEDCNLLQPTDRRAVVDHVLALCKSSLRGAATTSATTDVPGSEDSTYGMIAPLLLLRTFPDSAFANRDVDEQSLSGLVFFEGEEDSGTSSVAALKHYTNAINVPQVRQLLIECFVRFPLQTCFQHLITQTHRISKSQGPSDDFSQIHSRVLCFVFCVAASRLASGDFSAAVFAAASCAYFQLREAIFQPLVRRISSNTFSNFRNESERNQLRAFTDVSAAALYLELRLPRDQQLEPLTTEYLVSLQKGDADTEGLVQFIAQVLLTTVHMARSEMPPDALRRKGFVEAMVELNLLPAVLDASLRLDPTTPAALSLASIPFNLVSLLGDSRIDSGLVKSTWDFAMKLADMNGIPLQMEGLKLLAQLLATSLEQVVDTCGADALDHAVRVLESQSRNSNADQSVRALSIQLLQLILQ